MQPHLLVCLSSVCSRAWIARGDGRLQPGVEDLMTSFLPSTLEKWTKESASLSLSFLSHGDNAM